MASRTIVFYEDDLDGTEAAGTVTFALEGVQYEIDLSSKNADKLRTAMAPYVEAGRRVGGSRGRRSSSRYDWRGGSEGRARMGGVQWDHRQRSRPGAG